MTRMVAVEALRSRARTVMFGGGLDVAEARMLLSRILAAKPALSNPND
ncbi:MAG: hypothetical protein ABIS07_01850 [Dokdonella sp.]